MWMVEKDEWTGRAGSDCLLEVSWDGRVERMSVAPQCAVNQSRTSFLHVTFLSICKKSEHCLTRKSFHNRSDKAVM